jgi:ParB-like chromosome segregation protein Spo0J
MTGEGTRTIKLAFESEGIHLHLSQLVQLKAMRPGTKESKKYAQILRSVKAIGLVEAPVVSRDPTNPRQFFLLDGHLRIEALRDLGID